MPSPEASRSCCDKASSVNSLQDGEGRQAGPLVLPNRTQGLQDPSGNPKGSPASPWPQQGGSLVTAEGHHSGAVWKKDTVSVKPVVKSLCLALCSDLSKPVIFRNLLKKKTNFLKKKKNKPARQAGPLLNWLHPHPE